MDDDDLADVMGEPDGPTILVRGFDPNDLPDNIEDPYMAKAYLELAYNINGMMEEDGWDLPPVLLLLTCKEEDLAEHNLPGHLVEIKPTVLPGFTELVGRYGAQGGRPHHAVLHAAAAWKQFQEMPEYKSSNMGKFVQGLCFVHEAWSLSFDKDKPDPAAQEARRNRKIHEHPDRVEIRTVMIIGRHGLRVGLNAERDGIARHLIGQARPFMNVREYFVSGDLPNALQYFLEIIQQETGMDFEEWEKMYPYDPEEP